MTLSPLFYNIGDVLLSPSALLKIFIYSFILYLIINEYYRYVARIPRIIGPPGLPLIGNLAQIRVNAAEQYRKWSKEYGPIYQIMLGNIPVIVVNSAASARAIFIQNAQALSSRPEFYTFHKARSPSSVLSDTAGTTIGTSPYSDSLKRRRKGAASALNRPSVRSYESILDLETKEFVADILNYGEVGRKPVDPMPMIQRLSLSLALTLNWGVRMASQKEELFDEIIYVEEHVSKFRSTTGNLQDYIPLLRLNPINVGSAKARETRDRRDKYLDILNRGLDERIKDGTHQPCIQANIILDKETKLNKEELTSISLTMLSGGLDTLTTLMSWTIGFLSQRPELQDKAAEAIEHYQTGPGLQPLCSASDDQGCAYISALVRECLRYFTVLRLALPRTSIRDISYEGVTIPKGTVFFLNAWACNMDGEVWTDPEEFRVERWLQQPNAPLFTYGLGYRMCAGSLLANREMYLIFMRLLNNFRIEKHDDIDCDPITGNADPTSLVSAPNRFRVKFVPKNEIALRDAMRAFDEKSSEG
ncbi:hypothetical protein FQN54_007298 [Arachnomyces sp. PD_36]|nr:hypothetical protein FQN54_007298 [Arachnomyces sp. PD_36]